MHKNRSGGQKALKQRARSSAIKVAPTAKNTTYLNNISQFSYTTHTQSFGNIPHLNESGSRCTTTRRVHSSTSKSVTVRRSFQHAFSTNITPQIPKSTGKQAPRKPSKNRYKKLVSNPPRQILSGIQPTGVIHIGNLFGAVTNWVHLQHSEPLNAKKELLESMLDTRQRITDTIQPLSPVSDGDVAPQTSFRLPTYSPRPVLYTVVDLHALTIPKDPVELQNSTVGLTATLLGAGIDPSRSTLFIQSHVPQHTELTWLLTCNTPISWLYRMTQFKDKAAKIASNVSSQPDDIPESLQGISRTGGEIGELTNDQEGDNGDSLLNLPRGVSTGLLSYPLLMAADIILYNATHIPVGDDQRQHLEFTRDIVRLMNSQYGPTLVEPVPIHSAHSTRIMSLRTPTSKMSKSDPSPQGNITLADSDKDIQTKIARAVTDNIGGVSYSPERPGLKNLLEIYAASENMRLMQLHHHEVQSNLANTQLELDNVFADPQKLVNLAASIIPQEQYTLLTQKNMLTAPNSTIIPSLEDQSSAATAKESINAINEWLSISNTVIPTISPQQLADQHCDAKLSVLKPLISESLIHVIQPIRNTTKELLNNQQYLSEVTTAGADVARGIAETTMIRVREMMGLRYL